MRTNIEIRGTAARWQRRLLYPLVLSAWTLAMPAMATAPATGAHAPTSYRVVPLTNVSPAFGDINGKGQVAFTADPGNGTFARFYDGNALYPIGSTGTNAQALNNLGQVTGTNLGHAFRWSLATGLVDIGAAIVGSSSAFDINEKGHVVGEAIFTPDGATPNAFLWTPHTGMRDLGNLGGRSRAVALNDAGTVVGFSWTPGGNNTSGIAFRWTAAEGMRPLGTLPSQRTIAADVNEVGQIAGASPVVPGGEPHAFLWTPHGGLHDLGTGSGIRSNATRLNDKGMVIGTLSGRAVVFQRGFVWTREHGFVEIGADSPEPVFTSANGLNNHGQVVGAYGSHAYVWTGATGAVDLNTLVRDAPPDLVLREAHNISDNGSIVVESNSGLVLLVPQAAASHQAPVVGPIKFTGTARVNSILSLSANFTDVDRNDTHKATWSWGDGREDTGILSEKYGKGSVSGQHVYRKAGIYTVTLTVTDSGGKRTTVQRTVVVCGSGAHIAGEGWFMSPAGAAPASRQQPGTASFAFLSPAGGAAHQAAIQFDTPGLRLRSERVESLRIDGARVRYQGSATVNGAGNYRFALTALMSSRTGGAGAAERIRVQVWHHDPKTHAEVLDYDNGAIDAAAGEGSVIAEGSITKTSGD